MSRIWTDTGWRPELDAQPGEKGHYARGSDWSLASWPIDGSVFIIRTYLDGRVTAERPHGYRLDTAETRETFVRTTNGQLVRVEQGGGDATQVANVRRWRMSDLRRAWSNRLVALVGRASGAVGFDARSDGAAPRRQ